MRNEKSAFIAIAGLFFLASASVAAEAAVAGKSVDYEHDGVQLQGYIAWDDASDRKRPGILVVHEWWGLNDYARGRAEQLAKLGYVAFALDMYGKGKVTTHPEEASEWRKKVSENIDKWRARALAGLEILKNDPRVDTGRLAAAGYCFGGSTVQHLAYGGADLNAVVSFHGSLVPPPENAASKVKAAVLVCHGAADPTVPVESVSNYIQEMEKSGLRWRMAVYGGAKHGFTNPDADMAGMPALAYDRKADEASWEATKVFFAQELERL